MRAAVLECFGAPLRLADVPQPVADEGEVVVRTAGCGICRTDLHMLDGLAYRPRLPHILGHEPAGHIVSVGGGVRDWKVGDRVAPYLFDTCGHCLACLGGNEAQCEATSAILGVTRNGAFAEFFKVRADNLERVSEALDLSVAGLMSCAAITAVRAVRRSKVEASRRAAVIGAGGIGLLIVQILVARGVETHVFEPATAARSAALAAGAAGAYGPDDSTDLVFDCIFDLVGTARSTALAGRVICRMGRIVVVGEEAEFPALDTIAIAQREIEIVGSRNGSRRDAAEALALMADGVIRPRIADRIALDQLNDAMSAMRNGAVQGRILVEFPQ
jgi:propanol-preferring alcohol dehydrogenase